MIITMEKMPKRALEILKEWKVNDENPGREEMSNAEVLIAWPNWITKELLHAARKLRAIQFLSAGVDDVPYLGIPSNIRLFSNADAYSVSVAEHAWALVLSSAKNICHEERAKSRVLSGSNLLVLGCGGIGSEVARIGRGFKMRISGLSRSFKNSEYFDEKYYSTSELGRLLPQADVVVCALPSSKLTIGLLNYDTLRHAKNTCVLVNVARAEIFDREGILRLLKERPETRFGTDVFWRKDGKEVFDSKLWDFHNFVGTKHTAGVGASSEVREIAFVHAAENVALFLRSGSAKNEIKVAEYV